MRYLLLLFVWMVTSVPVRASEGAWPSVVRGFGLTVADAKNEAIKHLTERAAAFLAGRQPPLLAWRPDNAYVKCRWIIGAGHPGPDFVLDDVGPAKTWVYPVRALDWEELAALDQEALRADRRVQRLQWSAWILVAIIAVVGVVGKTVGCRQSASQRVPFCKRLG